NLGSRITYTLASGQTYYIEATSFANGVTGSYNLNVTSGNLSATTNPWGTSGGTVYDGTTPAPGTTETRAWIPVDAAVSSDLSNRSRPLYDNVINQFAVAVNPRYAQRDINGDGYIDTFCNIFVSDVTR